MRLIYLGSRPRDIAAGRRDIHVDPGDVFDVGDELGARLCEQTALFAAVSDEDDGGND